VDETAQKNEKRILQMCLRINILQPTTAWDIQVVKILIP